MSGPVGIETSLGTAPSPGAPVPLARESFPVHVPGIGPVSWSRDQLNAHAVLMGRTHQPDGPPVTIRGRWHPFFSRGVRQLSCCAACALDWPCPELRWAESWLGAKRRFRRGAGRHD
jgi:hypothetical protein